MYLGVLQFLFQSFFLKQPLMLWQLAMSHGSWDLNLCPKKLDFSMVILGLEVVPISVGHMAIPTFYREKRDASYCTAAHRCILPVSFQVDLLLPY
jgi:hypothetical protein